MDVWILEADIYRLRKALFDTVEDEQRKRLQDLLHRKQRHLATVRGRLI